MIECKCSVYALSCFPAHQRYAQVGFVYVVVSAFDLTLLTPQNVALGRHSR
jgi:hypothetical protein